MEPTKELLVQIVEAIVNILQERSELQYKYEMFFNDNDLRKTGARITCESSKFCATFSPYMAIQLEEQHGYEDGIAELYDIIVGMQQNFMHS